MPFTIYVDESGEAGISKVRDGKKPSASPYFVLGAAVLQPAGKIAAKRMLDGCDAKLGKKKWRHATDLDHPSKVLLTREMAKIHVRYVSGMSNKGILGEYRDIIENDPQKFYNKCLKYLLERVCGYLAPLAILRHLVCRMTMYRSVLKKEFMTTIA
jgi:hypothetical protein